jgi:hypothetical protein
MKGNLIKRIIPAAILALFATLCFGQLAYAKDIDNLKFSQGTPIKATAQTPQPASGTPTEQAVASTVDLVDFIIAAVRHDWRIDMCW